jgi:hypothetical protein
VLFPSLLFSTHLPNHLKFGWFLDLLPCISSTNIGESKSFFSWIYIWWYAALNNTMSL